MTASLQQLWVFDWPVVTQAVQKFCSWLCLVYIYFGSSLIKIFSLIHVDPCLGCWRVVKDVLQACKLKSLVHWNDRMCLCSLRLLCQALHDRTSLSSFAFFLSAVFSSTLKFKKIYYFCWLSLILWILTLCLYKNLWWVHLGLHLKPILLLHPYTQSKHKDWITYYKSMALP